MCQAEAITLSFQPETQHSGKFAMLLVTMIKPSLRRILLGLTRFLGLRSKISRIVKTLGCLTSRSPRLPFILTAAGPRGGTD